jgi:phytoene synthase
MKEINSAQGSRSFALALMFIPVGSRSKIAELYRWCRKCDDLIDEAPDLRSAQEGLRELIDGAESPDFRPPSWVPPEQVREFLEGMAMDVNGIRYQTLPELEVYCFRVAGVIGLMMCPLLGAVSTEALSPAVALGKAMQLTNIARDVQADAKIGRVYIPDQLLPGMNPETLAIEPERAFEAVRELLELADRWYESGLEGLRWLPFRSAFGIAVAGTVYREIGHKLMRKAKIDPVSAFRQRTVVSKGEKLIAVILGFFIVIRKKKTFHLGRVGRGQR